MKAALSGRSVLVTGGGDGIGRGVALACASAGAFVVVLCPRDNGAGTVALVEARGGQAVWVPGDVTRAADVEASVRTAVERAGGLDLLVHNATSRRSSEPARIEDLEDSLWEQHVSVSLRGAYLCARAAYEALAARRGSMVLMTSPAGMEGSLMLAPYGIVKAGLRGLVKSLAREWAPSGVRVNAISPLAETPAVAAAYQHDPPLRARVAARIPLGRLGEPETDIGGVVVFLASDAARYITGQTIPVDGGRYTNL